MKNFANATTCHCGGLATHSCASRSRGHFGNTTLVRVVIRGLRERASGRRIGMWKATTMKRTLTLTIHALASLALLSACGGQQKVDAAPTAASSTSAAPAASAVPIASASATPVAAAASSSATASENATPPAPASSASVSPLQGQDVGENIDGLRQISGRMGRRRLCSLRW